MGFWEDFSLRSCLDESGLVSSGKAGANRELRVEPGEYGEKAPKPDVFGVALCEGLPYDGPGPKDRPDMDCADGVVGLDAIGLSTDACASTDNESDGSRILGRFRSRELCDDSCENTSDSASELLLCLMRIRCCWIFFLPSGLLSFCRVGESTSFFGLSMMRPGSSPSSSG